MFSFSYVTLKIFLHRWLQSEPCFLRLLLWLGLDGSPTLGGPCKTLSLDFKVVFQLLFRIHHKALEE